MFDDAKQPRPNSVSATKPTRSGTRVLRVPCVSNNRVALDKKTSSTVRRRKCLHVRCKTMREENAALLLLLLLEEHSTSCLCCTTIAFK
ncbi:hypothetical protein Y032_0244g3534 [Ancylostoma ceylanicum]|uniref:Uncharacterized protein n=1 Tax=Ancylostoma ceylanicum TaxID=53326 RepID=A0A016SEB3_9BILA|nr:hypothetical protein Y032_0244g3534 [Ancylostoma ceylanicum]